MSVEGEIVQLSQPAHRIEEIAERELDKTENNIDVECLVKVSVEN